MISKEYLSIYSFNATSIRGSEKLSTFNNSFSGQSYDVISITETWLHDGINDAEILPNCSYDIYRRDRNHETSMKGSGGGIMLAVHKNFPSVRRFDLETVAEILWIEIPIDNVRKALIGTLYLPIQNEIVLQAVENSISKVNETAKCGDTIIMLGDYNMDDISWRMSSDCQYAVVDNITDICAMSDRFLEIINVNSLHQYNTLPTTELTRDRSTVNNHILDLVIANELDSVRIDIVENATSSTHKALEITARLNVNQSITRSERVAYNFKNADWDNIFCLLSCIFWSDWRSFNSVNDAFDHFYDVLHAVIKESIPTFKIRDKKFPSWYSKELIILVKNKERSRRKYIMNGRDKTSDAYSSFSKLRKTIKKKQKQDYAVHISSVECDIKRNPKRFWSHAKSLKSSKSLPNTMKYRETVYNTTESILKAFCLFFKSVFINFDQSAMPHCEPCYTSAFVMPHIKYEDVRNILRSLESSTSSGYDNISATFLIKCSNLLCKPLADLFNFSLSRGEYPDILKRDNVVPIFKGKGNKNSVECYRGISIQPIVAKVFEGFINRALRQHINFLIDDNQHGFLKSKSCVTNLAVYTDFISKSLDKKSQTHTIYTDFQKAFDVVPHKLLLLKLNRKFGIESNVFRWFESYLYGRFQRVVNNGVHSDWYSVTSGVPQGSKLGPTLFLMYINDIFMCVRHSQLLLFADDCKIFKEIVDNNDCELLQQDLNRIYDWCKKWQMKLHPEKCFFMNFSLKRSNDIVNEYSIGDTNLSHVFEMKDLGVYFTPNLNFNLHIKKITSKSLQMLGFIKRVTRHFTDPKTFHVLYNALVRCRLEFCSQIWNPSSVVSIKRLERVQKQYLKYVSFKSRVVYCDQINYEELCGRFNLKTLQSRRNIADLLFLNKLLCNVVHSPYLIGEVCLRIPRRILRDKTTFYVRSRIQLRKDSFMPRVLTLANKLKLYDDLVMRQPLEFKRVVTDLFI